jgi:predicted O-methyltransferase YrrM
MSIKRMAKRWIGDAVNPLIARFVSRYAFDMRYFTLWERHGFHVVPNHFYCPIPDTRSLDDSLWEEESRLIGIDMNEAAQRRLVTSVFPTFAKEFTFPMTGTKSEFYVANGTFESVDAEVLHSMIRHFQPRKMIEIGAGNSTLVSARACRLNQERSGVETELVVIEPYPNPLIQRGFPGISELVELRVEEVNLDLFRSLGENDILFIDSSHVVRTGGDVTYEMLEILPRLRPGVVVHIHDIYLPAEYPREEVLDQGLFFTEQYLLQAFLTFNTAFEVVWGASYMHLRHPDLLEACFPSYGKGNWWPASFWIRRKG